MTKERAATVLNMASCDGIRFEIAVVGCWRWKPTRVIGYLEDKMLGYSITVSGIGFLNLMVLYRFNRYCVFNG